MSEHTPAPWSENEWPQGDSSIGIGAIGTPIIAKVLLRHVSINQQKANARLIKASPELLIQLECANDNLFLLHSYLVDSFHHGSSIETCPCATGQNWRANREVIKKARGVQ